jgi:hypothetical protein
MTLYEFIMIALGVLKSKDELKKLVKYIVRHFFKKK